MLVTTSVGDSVSWNYGSETTDETSTIANIETIWATERPSAVPMPASSTSVVLNKYSL